MSPVANLNSRSPLGQGMSLPDAPIHETSTRGFSQPEAAAAQASELPDLPLVARRDAFVRSSSPEAMASQLVGLLAEAKLDLRELHVTDLTRGADLALSGGNMHIAMRPPSPTEEGYRLRRVELTLTSGPYGVDFSISEDGSFRVNRVTQDGKSVTSLMGDALKAKIMADPAVWGTLTAVAAAGVAYAAHEHVRRSGDPIRFDVFDTRVAQYGPWALRVNAEAELSGKDHFVRSAGVGATLGYQEGNLRAEVGVRSRRDEKPVATASVSYPLTKDISVQANARYRKDDYHVGVAVVGQF